MTRHLPDHRRSPMDEASGEQAVLAATRELLWIGSAGDAQAVAVRLVEALGGVVVPADQVETETLPVDVSFGQGVPLVPAAPSMGPAHMLLSRHLPGFLRDAHRAVELASRTRRLARDAEIDPLTGLATRRVLGRALGRLDAEDVVVMIDLDHFKPLNDVHGHAAGDHVLRTFGQAINATLRARDLAGRYGGEEFAVVLKGEGGPPDAEAYLRRLKTAWQRMRPHPVTFSAGLATAREDRSLTLQAADEAMYEAKRAGRDRWAWADERSAEPAEGPPVPPSGPVGSGFVAHSLLTVPEGGREALVASFEERLGRVEGWPGFRGLEVWADQADPTSFVMVSWWDTEAAFRAYMASEDHRVSHARIPGGEQRPRPVTFRRYQVVAR
jgi:diguanylate cyclase (GGDEF)-like protein